MALGTIASRGSGLLRQVILAIAIGQLAVANAYTFANNLPNMVYELLLGGVLSSVVVPLLVKAEKTDADGGIAFTQRLLTMTVAVFSAITLLAVLAAPALTWIVVSGKDSASATQAGLTTDFAYLLLFEIVFYALAAVFGAILNSKGKFAAPAWAPMLNNGIVILTAVVFWLLPGHAKLDATTITTAQILVLGIGTTLGIVVQALSLWIPLRRLGFRWKWRWDWRGTGLGETKRLAGWLVLYVALSQLGLLAVLKVAFDVGDRGPSVAIYNNAYLLFMLPHGIVAVSVITALLPRMSRSAVEQRFRSVADDLSLGTRLSATVLVPAAAIMIFLGGSLGVVLFGYGQTSQSQAETIGEVFSFAGIGLLPFAVSQLQTFVFYSMRDTKTPTMINLAAVVVRVAGAGFVGLTVDPARVLGGLMVVNALSYTTAAVLGGWLLNRRLGTIHLSNTLSTVARVAIASIPALFVVLGVRLAIDAFAGTGRIGGIISLVIGIALGTVVYLATALLLRVREIQDVLRMLQRRLTRT
jgi:putative peptidoglycan lipid II flippase